MTTEPFHLQVEHEIGRPDILFALALDEQQRIYVGSSDSRVHALDVPKKSTTPLPESHSGFVTGLVRTASGQLVSGAYDGALVWWERVGADAAVAAEGDQATTQAAEWRIVRRVPAHAKWIRRVAITPDRRRVVSVADDMVCRVWDTEDGALIHELRGHAERTPHHFPSMLYCASISSDGELLATGDKLGRAVIWDLRTGRQLGAVEAPILYTWDGKERLHSIGGLRSLAFSPDRRLLALGGIGTIGNIDHLGANARLEVFDWEQGERTHEFPGDDGAKGLVERLEFHPDGRWLCGAGGDNGGFIQFWDLDARKVLRQDKAPMHVHDLAFNDEHNQVWAAGHGKVISWSLVPDGPLPPLEEVGG